MTPPKLEGTWESDSEKPGSPPTPPQATQLEGSRGPGGLGIDGQLPSRAGGRDEPHVRNGDGKMASLQSDRLDPTPGSMQAWHQPSPGQCVTPTVP